MLNSSRGSGGWLAHHDQQSPSPSEADSDSEASSPSHHSIFHDTGPIRLPVSPPPRTSHKHISLLESQPLPPPQVVSGAFSLPDPRYPYQHAHAHRDAVWTSLWLAGLSICLFFCLVVLFFVSKPPTKDHLPYTTLLHTVPLLTILTLLSAVIAYAHVFVLRILVKPVMVATSVFVPVTLLFSAIWAFIGSFMWEEGKEPSWGESTGLRIFSLIPLALAFWSFRRLMKQNLPHAVQQTSSLLKLTTDLIFIHNPLLLALSPAILLAMLVVSIPFVTLIFRLLLVGYRQQTKGGVEWHVQAWADWAIVATVVVWLWTWGVVRGVLRVTCAGVIGSWYYADGSLPPPLPLDTHIIHSAFHRSTNPSLGTSALSALIVTSLRSLAMFCSFLRLLPVYVPFQPVASISGYLLGYFESWAAGPGLGGGQGALVYAGLSGDGFWYSRDRIAGLSATESRSRGTGGGGFLRRRNHNFTPIPFSLLTVFPLTLSFPAALLTYLFVAHTLNSPNEALGAAVLAGGVTALVARFCEGVLIDAGDTLWVCYLLDKEEGVQRRKEVFDVFDGPCRPQPSGHPSTSQPSHPPPLTPSHTRRLSADTLKGTGPRVPLARHPEESHELLLSPPRASPTSLPSYRSPPAGPSRHLPLVEEIDVDPFDHSHGEDVEDMQIPSNHSSLTMQARHDDSISTDSEGSERLFPSGFLG